MIENDLSGEKSKEFGVNRNSILNSLAYFNVCDGSLLPDVMHDLLEGALQYEVKLMLRLMIHLQGYFSIDELNSRLQHMELGYMESNNRPTPLSANTLNSEGNSLKQNGLFIYCYYVCHFLVLTISFTNVALWTNFASSYWRVCA